MSSALKSDASSPKKEESKKDTTPVSEVASGPAPSDKKLKIATEVPTPPEQRPVIPLMKPKEESPVGNPQFGLALRLSGQSGSFFRRENFPVLPTFLTIDSFAMRIGAGCTLQPVLHHYIEQKGHIQDGEIRLRVARVATTLANGVTIAIYMKLAYLHSVSSEIGDRYLKMPTVPENFEIPAPYALAISHLGNVEAVDLPKRLVVSPTLSADQAKTYGLPAAERWSVAAYAQAVEYAKSLGMPFSKVNLEVKLGSSWWLYRQSDDNEDFTLECPLPSSNYTEATAVVHTLFCAPASGNVANPFCELTPLGNQSYGSMLRKPPIELNVSSFLAITEDLEQAWKVV